MDILTTYLAPARLISEGKKQATGTPAFVGRASVEMDVIDSVTNQRLVAVVDKRAAENITKVRQIPGQMPNRLPIIGQKKSMASLRNYGPGSRHVRLISDKIYSGEKNRET